VIYVAYKVDTRIFNCKNSPIFCDSSSTGKITSSTDSIALTKHIEVAHPWIEKKLLTSLRRVLLGHCLKNSRKDLEWYHQRKCDLSFSFSAWLDVPYYGVGYRYNILSAHSCSKYVALKNFNVELFETRTSFNLSIRFQILILRRVLMRSNITNPKTEYYFHYRGSVYCTELLFGTFCMRSF
jgi:hypothetical protein